MLALFQPFHRKRSSVGQAPDALTSSPQGLLRPESATALLGGPRRQKLLEHIWQRTSVSRRQFDALYLAPIRRYAELVQQFPASESHHHAYPGGMLDHGLEIVAYALKLRQSHLLPTSASSEAQAAQGEVWTAVTAYGALLHDVGKIAMDLQVEYADGTAWHPWHGPLRRPYRFRYRAGREYRLHGVATGLLYVHLLDSSILDWLSDYPEAWSALLYVLAGQFEHAGRLGELVTQADQASVAQALGGDPAKALAAPRHALQRKLLDGLRYLLREELKLNQPQASDAWLTQDALWLVSKTVSDKLRAYLLSQGIDGIPSNNTAIFNVLQDHGILQATPDGKAIWRATVTSDSGWSNSFTFLKVAPAVVWEPADRPAAYSGMVRVDNEAPAVSAEEGAAVGERTRAVGTASAGSLAQPDVANTTTTPAPTADSVEAVLGLLEGVETPVPIIPAVADTVPSLLLTEETVSHTVPAPNSVVETVPSPDAPGTGAHFMAWLGRGVRTHKLIVNDAKAQVHTVAGAIYLVTPGIFQRYVQEHPQVASLAKQEGVADWRWVQKQFERLRLHRKQPNGLNIWACSVAGPRKSRRLHGYLLEDASALFDSLPLDNPYLSLESVAAHNPVGDNTAP